MRARIPACCLALCALAGCEKRPPPAPPSVDPGGTETITGTERLGWEQRAADTAELATVRYAIYVDGARSELAGATCGATRSADAFSCSAPIPRMPAGTHTLELASFVIDGSVLESARSAALRVTVLSSVALSAPNVAQGFSPASWPTTITTSDGVTLRLELVSDDVREPTDLAFAPDGHVFVAERGGSVRILSGARETVVTNGELLALALDPQFERTHFVFVVYRGASTSGGRGFSLARFREVSGTLGDRAILLDGVRAAADDASAALRFGPDGKLYAAFDDGGDPALAGDLASPNGKVLRLNADGSTPDDQAGATPLYSSAYHAARGLDWQPSTGMLWVADASALSAVDAEAAAERGRKRGVTRRTFALPRGLDASAMAFYRGPVPAFRGNLLIASTAGQQLLRVRFDPRDSSVIVSTERLLDHRIGAIHAVASASDGSIYITADHAIGRLVPVR